MSDKRLVELVTECIARLEDEGDVVLDELCAREPGLAAQLRERITKLRASGMLEPSPLAAGVPERLGDFQLGRRIASGGMGVVYEARQLSIDRRVALKLVRPEMLYFPGARERFRREIDAVARLSHPGIAAVYVCGEHGELPYFAMEFVEGGSLADVLGDLAGRTPSSLRATDLWACLRARAPQHRSDAATAMRPDADWPSVCARLVRDACNVVEYAHAAGVLHRDLKPGNVLVTPAGRVVVVDFGLAALEGGTTLTRTGAQLGSLPYMAPEQLRGDPARIGPATDVYGLGVTLFELLAFDRPFEATSAAAYELAITTGVRRPLRELNPQVSRDLETVVLCALEADPQRRYATPAEFAADLSRALSGRPVNARRVGALGRTRRWIARRPARALLSIGLPLLTVAGLWAWRESRQVSKQARTAEQIAREQFDVTLAAIDTLASQGGEQPIERLLSLVDEARRTYAALESSGADAERLETDRSRLERTRAQLLEQLGRRLDAEQAFREAAENARRLVQEGGVDLEFRRAHAADVLSQLGGVLQQQARFQEAYEAFEEACEIARPALDASPRDELGRRAWASAEINRAQLLRLAGELDEARAGFARALPELREQARRAPSDAQGIDMLGLALAGSAWVDWNSGSREAAFESWREALDAFERAHRLEPDEQRYADDVGTSWAHYGRALVSAGQLALAAPALEKACAVLTELASRHPEFPDYRQRLIQATDSMAWLRKLEGQPERALVLYLDAVAQSDELATRYPDSATFLHDLPVTLSNCALCEIELGKLDDALRHYRRASEILDSLGADVAPDAPLARPAIWVFLGHADAALRAGETTEASGRLERTAALSPPDPAPWVELGKLWSQLAAAAPSSSPDAGTPPLDRAFASVRKAVELGWDSAAQLETEPAWATLRQHPDFESLRPNSASAR